MISMGISYETSRATSPPAEVNTDYESDHPPLGHDMHEMKRENAWERRIGRRSFPGHGQGGDVAERNSNGHGGSGNSGSNSEQNRTPSPGGTTLNLKFNISQPNAETKPLEVQLHFPDIPGCEATCASQPQGQPQSQPKEEGQRSGYSSSGRNSEVSLSRADAQDRKVENGGKGKTRRRSSQFSPKPRRKSVDEPRSQGEASIIEDNLPENRQSITNGPTKKRRPFSQSRFQLKGVPTIPAAQNWTEPPPVLLSQQTTADMLKKAKVESGIHPNSASRTRISGTRPEPMAPQTDRGTDKTAIVLSDCQKMARFHNSAGGSHSYRHLGPLASKLGVPFFCQGVGDDIECPPGSIPLANIPPEFQGMLTAPE